jgi:hypothetical protein
MIPSERGHDARQVGTFSVLSENYIDVCDGYVGAAQIAPKLEEAAISCAG